MYLLFPRNHRSILIEKMLSTIIVHSSFLGPVDCISKLKFASIQSCTFLLFRVFCKTSISILVNHTTICFRAPYIGSKENTNPICDDVL